MTQKKICFIGAGNMTRSIVSGLVKSGYPSELIHATNPSEGKLIALQQDLGIQVSHDNLAAAEQADVIVLSVKPQLMQQVCEHLASLDLSNKLIVTIAAGITANRYHDYFNQPIKFIRSMPNTPTQIGYGMTGLFAEASVSEADKALCEQIMQTGGEVVWVDKEDDLNQVIALAGSSPAYFFLMMEAMIDSAKQDGVDEAVARALVQQAALGAAQMVKQNQQLTAGQLRENVTSKGGTTAQALAAFEKAGLRDIVRGAMHDCMARADEMAKQF
ncbi:pyrroline-5-carboxylate reductase [Shewanella sp. Isolate11]|uniref:pyrroline-5-carboxylate reductase n=1 Tax=Shewanella sp. Isolate11 TaxID=2908530 RepID=UPI001EFE87E6|nr:pyrroline-5-carboxylate reductase [Shewanella sp. Isolate11]MCG9696023.1 pyrroline-5-carboxylate reductase [Shewanella sp. Isolate11]